MQRILLAGQLTENVADTGVAARKNSGQVCHTLRRSAEQHTLAA